MKKTVSLQDFREDFKNYGRGNQFSYDGLTALFYYLLDCEEDSSEEIELDVIVFCCDYTEYENLEEFKKDYSSREYKDIKSIEDDTCLIMIDDKRFIIRNF